MSSTFVNYSTLNSYHKWEDLCIQFTNQQTCTLEPSLIQRTSDFQFDFCWCLVIDLLMEHKLENIISCSIKDGDRTRKVNQIRPRTIRLLPISVTCGFSAPGILVRRFDARKGNLQDKCSSPCLRLLILWVATSCNLLGTWVLFGYIFMISIFNCSYLRVRLLREITFRYHWFSWTVWYMI